MSPERRAQLAEALKKNKLLPELFDERRAELRDSWEEEKDAEVRNLLWIELHALNEMKDFLYARIQEYSAGKGSEV